MSFPKKGKDFPKESGHAGRDEPVQDASYAEGIALVLRRSLGGSRAGVKTVASWTGANEKTVKNWFSGRYGPSGKHLVYLAHHSDELLETFLALAGRQELILSVKLLAAERAVEDLLAALRQLRADGEGPAQ